MSARSIQKNIKRIIAGIFLTFVGLGSATTAFARITANTIDPVATLTENGHHVIVTGPIECTEGERAYLRVTVTQRSTGAVAEGRNVVTCTGAGQPWEVHLSVLGEDTFEEGSATAVALGRTTDYGATDDAHQWLVGVTLIAE